MSVSLRILIPKAKISVTAIFLVAILISCSEGFIEGSGGSGGPIGQEGPGPNEIWLQNNTFKPASITVAPGTTIRWTNKDKTTHSITSKTGLFDSGSLAPATGFTYTFSEDGVYSYYCSFYPGMSGIITVK